MSSNPNRLLWTALLGCGALLVGCDAVYYVRLSAPLPPERSSDLSMDLKARLEQRLAVTCKDTEYALLDNSLETGGWQLQRCASASDYAQIVVAESPRDLVVEIHQIGGSQEPEAFRRYRLGAYATIHETVPTAPIAVASDGSIPDRSFDFGEQP